MTVHFCTSGETGASCLKGADCKSGHCDLTAEGAPFWSVCADRLGKTGEACQINDDCQNQVCGQNSIGKVCANGQVGDACGEAAECASGFCAPAPMIFFQCSNGAPGDRCFKDADCTSQHCALDASQGYAVCGP